MGGSAGVKYPIGGARRRCKVDGAESGGEGVGVPWGRDLGPRLIEGTGVVGRQRNAVPEGRRSAEPVVVAVRGEGEGRVGCQAPVPATCEWTQSKGCRQRAIAGLRLVHQ
jgi:hypothetical protein